MQKILLILGGLFLGQVTLLAKSPLDTAPISIMGFTLINASTNTDIVNLSDGDVINLAELPTRKLNIVARIQPNTLPLQIGSVAFTLNDLTTLTDLNQVENIIPFAMGGDSLGYYNTWTPTLGSYTLTATPYVEDNGGGKAGVGQTIHFTVVDKPLNLPKAVYRINSGGEDYITPEGVIFKADNYLFNSLATYTNNTIQDIRGTTADGLYKTERTSNGDYEYFFYNFPVATGNYTVKLHFAEIYFGVPGGLPSANPVGSRVFDVYVDGDHFLNNLDVAAEAGVATALVKTFEVSSNDGNIIISFESNGLNRAKISAIEVLESAAPNLPPVVNAGGNRSIRLPQNSTTLVGTWSDPDGYITNVEWTQVSGPAATLSGVNTSNLGLSNLVSGTYVFRLTVTDNSGLTGSDEVVLVVLAAESLLVTAYPNPVVDVLRIAADPESKDPVDIRLYDRFGNLYYEKLGVNSSEEHTINVSSFPPNIYLLEAQSGEDIQTVQVLKN